MLADVHMSNRLQFAKPTDNGRTDRLDDQLRLWKHVKLVAKSEGVREILVLGDLFDKSSPDPVTLSETASALSYVAETVPVYVMGGNHDAVDPVGGSRFTSEVFRWLGSRVRYMGTDDWLTTDVETPEWLRFWPVEFEHVEETKRKLARIRKFLEGDRRAVEVLLLHNSIVGCTHDKWKCSDGISQKDATRGFNWTFAGHFHTAQRFGKTGMYLSSPLHFRFDDVGRAAGFWVVQFSDDGSCEKKFIPSKLPKFHIVNWPSTGKLSKMQGDYVRVIVENTHAEFTQMKPALLKAIEEMVSAGIRASWKHKPIYHHVERSVSKKRAKSKNSARGGNLIDSYVDETCVVTDGLNTKLLKRIGRQVLSAVDDGGGVSSRGSVDLVRIKGSDFCQFGSFDVPLRNLGLVWVGGKNKDTSGAGSNGAGKTNFLKSIGWGLFGEMPDKEAADDVIRDGQPKTSIALEMTDGWTFERNRRKGVETVTLKQHGEKWKACKADTVKKVVELIGLDWRSWLATRYYGKGFSKRFIHPETSDSDRKSVLHRIMGTEYVALGQKYASERAREIHDEILELESRVSGLEIKLEAMDTEELLEREQRWYDDRERRASRAQSSRDEYRKAAKSCKRNVRSVKEIREERDKLVVAKEKLRDVLRLEAKAQKKQKELDALVEEGLCPECGSSVGKSKESKAHVKKIEDSIAELKRRAGVLCKQASLDGDGDDIPILDVRIKRLEDDERSTEKAIQKAKWNRERAVEMTERVNEIESEENPYTVQLETINDERASIKEDIKNTNSKLSKRRRTLAHWEFWKRSFGPSGLPSYLFDSIMPALTERTNVYLETLADGDITVEFSSQKELQSREKRDRIGITWIIEGIKNHLPSAGQWRKIALMDVGDEYSGCGGLSLLALDEMLDGVDAVGRDRLVQLLTRLRRSRGSIFVVSHEEISDAFERSIMVVKKNGVSALELNL